MFWYRVSPERSSIGPRAVAAEVVVLVGAVGPGGEPWDGSGLPSEVPAEVARHELPDRVMAQRKPKQAVVQPKEISSVISSMWTIQLLQPLGPRCKALAVEPLPNKDNAVTVSTHGSPTFYRRQNRTH